MAKGILEFDLSEPFEREAHMRAVKADSAYRCLWDIENEIFRPASKHGYKDEEIQSLLEKTGVDGEFLISLLKQKFLQILEENGVSFDEYS